MLGIGIGVNRLTGLLGEILPELTISTQPTLAGFPTTIDAGTTWATLAATLTQKGQATDGTSTVAGVPSFIGISDPSVGGEVATAVRFTFAIAGSQTSLVTLALDPAIEVPVPVPAPVITGLPTISGIERVGELLTATPASVTNGGTLTWQWLAGGVAIEGAESITFSLTLAQEGTAITVRQTQTNATGADTATSTATGTIVHVAPTASNALADQSFTIGTGVQTYAAAGDFTGEELTFSLNTVTGVTVNAATGVVSFDTDTMALQASTSIVVTATNTGGSVNSGFSVSITAVAFAFTDNADGTLDVTTEGTAPTPTITNNGDGTATTDEAGAYIYKPSANAEDDFTGAIGSSTLATATGVGTFKVYKRVQTGLSVTDAAGAGVFGDLVQSKPATNDAPLGAPGGTSLTPTLPAVATTGNLLVLTGGPDKGTAPPTAPAGFSTAVNVTNAAGDSAYVFYKISDGTEQAVTLSWASDARAACTLAEYAGPFDPAPLDVSSLGSTPADVTTLSSGTTASTTQADVLLVAAAFKESTLSPGGGFDPTEFYEYTSTATFGNEIISLDNPFGDVGTPRVGSASAVASSVGTYEVTATVLASDTGRSPDTDAMTVWLGAFKKGA